MQSLKKGEKWEAAQELLAAERQILSNRPEKQPLGPQGGWLTPLSLRCLHLEASP